MTPLQAYRLDRLRRASRLLDSSFVVPGLGIRIGLDPIIGLIPGVGDLVSPIFALVILVQARQLGLPGVVQARMILNVAIDALVGTVPVLGDLFDVLWKANDRNMDLLERHAFEIRYPSGDWIFVGGVVLAIAAAAMVPALLLTWLLAALL